MAHGTILRMLPLLVRAAFQVSGQTVPPITVVVQQPQGGTPEWIKVLVPATVGALVGIMSNIAMEYVKPWIQRSNLQRTMKRDLMRELAENKLLIEEHLDFYQRDQSADTIFKLRTALEFVNDDRFRFYYQDHKTLLYAVDPDKALLLFYNKCSEGRPHIDLQDDACASHVWCISTSLKQLEAFCERYRAYEPHSISVRTLSANRNKTEDLVAPRSAE